MQQPWDERSGRTDGPVKSGTGESEGALEHHQEQGKARRPREHRRRTSAKPILGRSRGSRAEECAKMGSATERLCLFTDQNSGREWVAR